MSEYTNYDQNFSQIYDQERKVIGADVIAGLLHMHCGKELQEISENDKDLHILDAGSGTGSCSKELIDLGIGKITLLDASPEMLKIAKKKLNYAMERHIIDQVIEEKLPTLPFANGSFDAVMYNLVLHHLEKPEDKREFRTIQTTLHNTKKILRPKGLLVISTVLPSIIKGSLWYTQIYQPINDKTVKYLPTTLEWLDLFSKCGFRCVSAMNFLFSEKVDHFDPEGPLREEWRIGTHDFATADEQEKKTLMENIMRLKHKGLLQKFMNEHDHVLETGMKTLFVCISD